jgi:hypothetical protein
LEVLWHIQAGEELIKVEATRLLGVRRRRRGRVPVLSLKGEKNGLNIIQISRKVRGRRFV